MRGRPGPLLCELHAHTRWSDGTLTVADLVDLYGRSSFDVLCVTDLVVERRSVVRGGLGGSLRVVGRFVAEIEREAERGASPTVCSSSPGVELTYNDDDPSRAAHAVAVGLRSFVSVNGGIAEAIETAAEAGAAIIAAHPFDTSPQPS